MPTTNPDFDLIQRALRDITHIADADIVRVLKGILERQARMLAKIADNDARVAALERRRGATE
jgi:hypothetical protein